jgi:hypothetical protein
LFFIDRDQMIMKVRTRGGLDLGEVPSESIEDNYWLCPVFIGEASQQQMVLMDFDTGSADFWGNSQVLTVTDTS